MVPCHKTRNDDSFVNKKACYKAITGIYLCQSQVFCSKWREQEAAKLYNYNCISVSVFNIPITQIYNLLHAFSHLQCTWLTYDPGLFTKVYDMLEEECHKLVLELACTYSDSAPSNYATTATSLKKCNQTKKA